MSSTVPTVPCSLSGSATAFACADWSARGTAFDLFCPITSSDPYNLQRFIDAQESSYEQALAELQAGRKQSHWIWYIFPQVAGLGSSTMARMYSIQSRAEAAAYLAHPILGVRLHACAAAVLQHGGQSISAIMGSPDDIKLRSSMTLFARVADPADAVFQGVLDAFYASQSDARTLEFLENSAPSPEE